MAEDKQPKWPVPDFEIEVRTADPEEMSVATAKAIKALPDKWADTMLSMYDQGCSDSEVMRSLNITPARWDQLMLDTSMSNFSEIVEVGRMLARAYWEGMGRANVMSKRINVALYNLQMQNRFGWTTKSEESRTNILPENLNTDELDEKLRTYLKRFANT